MVAARHAKRKSLEMDYFRPSNLPEALDWLAREKGAIVAGCTDVFAATTAPALPGPRLDVTAIDGLRGISQTDDMWRIGGATTWTDIIRADLPPAFDGLKTAGTTVGSVQIQNAGTIAGNLCNASPAADGVPPLLTLDAKVELASRAGTRTLGLDRFLLGPRQTARADDEILTAIVVPKAAANGRSTFAKLGARKYLVISIAMVAARLVVTDDRIDDIAVAVGSCSAVAIRLSQLEAALKGQMAGPDLGDIITAGLVADRLSPISDVRADAAYRGDAATELVRRAVLELCP